MERPFVRVVDAHRKERVINILQIVEIHHEVDSWQVCLTKGDPIRLAPEEADKLVKRLPGVEPPKQLKAD